MFVPYIKEGMIGVVVLYTIIAIARTFKKHLTWPLPSKRHRAIVFISLANLAGSEIDFIQPSLSLIKCVSFYAARPLIGCASSDF